MPFFKLNLSPEGVIVFTQTANSLTALFHFTLHCSNIICFILKVEAESVPEISLRYEITAVPTFIFLKVIGILFTYY